MSWIEGPAALGHFFKRPAVIDGRAGEKLHPTLGTDLASPPQRRHSSLSGQDLNPSPPKLRRSRNPVAIGLGIAGTALYNWWLVTLFDPRLIRSVDELFSDLEAEGQPHAVWMQRADLLAGILMALAFLIQSGVLRWRLVGKGNPISALRGEQLAMFVFAISGALGGIWPEACPEGVSAACRSAEIHLQLPAHHYLHMLVGVVEFASITIAIRLAYNRTRPGQKSHWGAHAYNTVWVSLIVGYPLLGASYLFNRFGAPIEAAFFIFFSAMVIVHIVDPAISATPGSL